MKLQWWFGIVGQLVLPRWAAGSVRYAVWFVFGFSGLEVVVDFVHMQILLNFMCFCPHVHF